MLINCVAYEHGRKLADIPIEAIDEFCAGPAASSGSRCATPPTTSCARCSTSSNSTSWRSKTPAPHQRPKIEGVRHDAVRRDEAAGTEPGELEFGEVAIFVGANFVLSVRNRSIHGFLGVRERVRARAEHCARARASCSTR